MLLLPCGTDFRSSEMQSTNTAIRQMMALEPNIETIESTCCYRNALKMLIKCPSCFRFVTNMRWTCLGVGKTSVRSGGAFISYNRIPSFWWVFLYFFLTSELSHLGVFLPHLVPLTVALHSVFFTLCFDQISQEYVRTFFAAHKLIFSVSFSFKYERVGVQVASTTSRSVGKLLKRSLWLFSVPC